MTTATRSPRGIVGEVDTVGCTDAAHDVAFGVAERHRSGRGGRRTARRAICQRVGARHPGGAIPGQPPSALTSSSGVTGLSGVSGGVSIEMFLMKRASGVREPVRILRQQVGRAEQPASAAPSSTTPAVASSDRSFRVAR